MKKDKIYYSNLIYTVKEYADFELSKDIKVEYIISNRMPSISVLNAEIISNVFSKFQLDMFMVIKGIL